MKGDTCGFLHQFDPERMPVCRSLLKFGVCKEPGECVQRPRAGYGGLWMPSGTRLQPAPT